MVAKWVEGRTLGRASIKFHEEHVAAQKRLWGACDTHRDLLATVSTGYMSDAQYSDDNTKPNRRTHRDLLAAEQHSIRVEEEPLETLCVRWTNSAILG